LPPTPQNPGANGSIASPDGQSGQDYSAQWAEYYRYYGMEKEAEMIEQMAIEKLVSC